MIVNTDVIQNYYFSYYTTEIYNQVEKPRVAAIS